MLKENKPTEEVGVVIGRFQVDDLHDGHKDLLNSVFEVHQRVIIFVGVSAAKCTMNNPLDFDARRMLLQEHYPDATIVYIRDRKSDESWSEDLDNQISNLIGPGQKARLYGSRDSFIPYYHGRYATTELTQEKFLSGTEIRQRLSARAKSSKEFRQGAIWAMANQWPRPMFCVDIAIFNDDDTQVLLGRKKGEDKYRFVGGFVENGETPEMAAQRETFEETHLKLKKLTYIKGFPINDWRYRSERDKITTMFFAARIDEGKPIPDDDICELRWFDFNENLVYEVVDNHKQLVQILLEAE